MALPANITTVTVSHKHTAINGNAMSGTVTWALPVDLLDAAATATINASTLRAQLDITGAWSVIIPVVDDPDVSPTGWTYTVTFNLTDPLGGTRTLTKSVQITTAMAPAIDWSALADVAPVTEVSPYAKALRASATRDFPSLAAAATATQTITVTGAAVGDPVAVGPPAALNTGLMVTGYVSAANTVTIRLYNSTTGAVDPASATWTVSVIK